MWVVVLCEPDDEVDQDPVEGFEVELYARRLVLGIYEVYSYEAIGGLVRA